MHLVEVPDIAGPPMAFPEFTGVGGSEVDRPLADGLVANGDATLDQEVFNVSENQRGAAVGPHREGDNVSSEAAPMIERFVLIHAVCVPEQSLSDRTL